MTKLHKMRRSPKWHAGHWGALNRWVGWERWGRHECQKENSTQKHDHNIATSHMWKLFLVFCFCSVLISLEDVLALWHCERIIDSFSNVSSGYMKPQQGTGLSWLGPIANPKDSFSVLQRPIWKEDWKGFPQQSMTDTVWPTWYILVPIWSHLKETVWKAVPEHYRRLDRCLKRIGAAELPFDASWKGWKMLKVFFCWNTFATLLFVFVFWGLMEGFRHVLDFLGLIATVGVPSKEAALKRNKQEIQVENLSFGRRLWEVRTSCLFP